MIGRRLGHYLIEKRLGAGGMGIVYRARDTRLERPVAIKVVGESSAADPVAQARLLREARAASALNHPNICTVHEVADTDGLAYIVMELVEGTPLDRRIPPGGLPPDSLARLGLQLADALEHAHARGVVHRDLKPQNVVVTEDGRAKVLDFGVARRVEEPAAAEAATRTRSGSFGGTVAYMSPESLRDEGGDRRSDIWALGVLLYEMATGTLPFGRGRGFEVASAILRDPPAPLPFAVPQGLRTVILRCLAKEPEQRYQHAAEVRAALEAIESSPAPPLRSPRRRAAKPRRAAAGRARGTRVRALAVLPLENLSGDPAQDYFADGMTEALIASLAKIETLKVISRTSVMRYKGARKPLPEIARELGIDAVLEGSVLRSGDRVRITAQLIHATTERHLWAETYDRDLRDVLALQSEVARAVVQEIRVKTSARDEARWTARRRVSPAAFEAYLRGRHAWSRRTEEDLRKAVSHFQNAIDLDPTYALAYVGLADSYNILGFWGSLPPGESFPLARAAATKALEVGETLGEAHASLAYPLFHYDWNWADAEEHFALALRLNPGYATTHHWHGIFLASLGKFDEALAEMRRAEELDPLSLILRAATAWVLYFARRHDEAIEHSRAALDLDPQFGPALWSLGLACIEKKLLADAILALERAAALSETPFLKATLGHALAVAGRNEEALGILSDLEAASSRRYVRPYDLATIHLGLGDRERALEYLERASAERGNWLNYLRVDPKFEALRPDPRFRDLVDRVFAGAGRPGVTTVPSEKP